VTIAPTHLRAGTRRWYADVIEQYDLEPYHERPLQAAAEAWDRLQEARATLRKDGTYISKAATASGRILPSRSSGTPESRSLAAPRAEPGQRTRP
jgi:hypothetical protein